MTAEPATAAELRGEYAAWWATRPERFASFEEGRCWLHVPDWPMNRTDWPEWAWPHLTDAMVEADDDHKALPFKVVYALLVERSGEPMPVRAVLQYLARRCDREGAHHRHCWPPLDTIADRVGAKSKRTVQAAIRRAEAQGWLLVVRHARKPSDYVLDVPDLLACPCRDCRADAIALRTDKGAGDAPQGAGDAPQGAGDARPRVQEMPTHLGSTTSIPSPVFQQQRAPQAAHAAADPSRTNGHRGHAKPTHDRGDETDEAIARLMARGHSEETARELIADGRKAGAT